MKFKSSQAQDYYNEYLELKQSLIYLTDHLNYYENTRIQSIVKDMQIQIEEKTKRLDFVLKQLELHGVSMKNLIYLSCGLDVE